MLKFFPFLLVFIQAVFGESNQESSFTIQPASLLHRIWKQYSQSGEEGIISEILERMKIDQGFFVEFGAHDGILFSNTRFLADKGWKGAFIESDKVLFPKLLNNCKALPNILCINEFVATGFPSKSGRTFDDIADEYFPNQEIDIVSIDIDGLDYLVFDNMKHAPKIVCIESSGFWHPLLDVVIPESVAARGLGQPLSVIYDIARKKGYEPICFLTTNLFLVRKEYYHLFSDIKNDPVTLWFDSWRLMSTNGPRDQVWIMQERELHDYIKRHDPYPTPPLGY